jgi:hypothetical protein
MHVSTYVSFLRLCGSKIKTLFGWDNLAGLKQVLNQPANQLEAAPSHP